MIKAYPHIYKLLLHRGHGAAKAAEILLDARRKDRFAMSWIKIIFLQR